MIKPCPFCGAQPEDSPTWFADSQGTKWGSLVCLCGVVGPEVRTGYKTVDQWMPAAIEAWNERYDDQPMQSQP